MMVRVSLLRGIAASMLVALAVPVSAQTTSLTPANLPPAGFTGAQYVDNKGCIFIRAGTSGATTWVPRVTRDRRPICGYKPSFSGSSAQAAAAPKVTVLGASTTRAPAASASGVLPQDTATSELPPNTRVLPRHLYEQRKALGPVKTPRGYRPAWSDGRLNPRRAEQTLAGQAQMRRFWTDTVPRRLID
jgi:hypothetical protein